MNIETRIPVEFGELTNIDDRFMKVKIWIVNVDAPNYNNSYFSKEVVLDALESIKNTPILGYVTTTESRLGVDEKDFNGHEIEIKIDENGIKQIYKGEAYGCIPESCNPKFEFREDENGNIQEYLTVEGILWRKLNDATDILERDGEKFQSMELHDKDYEGYFDESDNLFHFTKFKFFGACILGNGAMPAIPNSTIEQMFSRHNIQSEISKKMSEYSHLFEKHLIKSKEVHDVTLEELLSKYSITAESLIEKGIDAEEFSIEELEAKIQEAFASNEENSDNVNQDEGTSTEMEEEQEDNSDKDTVDETGTETESEFEQVEDDAEDEKQDKFTLSFELSHEDIRRQMWDKIDSHMAEKGFGGSWHYIVTVYDTNVIVEDDMGNKFYKVDYTKEDDVITFGDAVEVHPMFLTSEEKGALELLRSNFEKLEEENKELKAFQVEVNKSQHEAEAEELFSQFSKLSDDDLADLRSEIHNFSIEQIESKLYELLGRKATKFSRKEKEATKIQVKIKEDEAKSSYSHIFSKHGLN